VARQFTTERSAVDTCLEAPRIEFAERRFERPVEEIVDAHRLAVGSQALA